MDYSIYVYTWVGQYIIQYVAQPQCVHILNSLFGPAQNGSGVLSTWECYTGTSDRMIKERTCCEQDPDFLSWFEPFEWMHLTFHITFKRQQRCLLGEGWISSGKCSDDPPWWSLLKLLSHVVYITMGVLSLYLHVAASFMNFWHIWPWPHYEQTRPRPLYTFDLEFPWWRPSRTPSSGNQCS